MAEIAGGRSRTEAYLWNIIALQNATAVRVPLFNQEIFIGGAEAFCRWQVFFGLP